MTDNPQPPTLADEVAHLRKQAVELAEMVKASHREAFDTEGAAGVWRDLREAADALYAASKELGGHLLSLDPNSRGWHNNGRPVEVKRRFDVELLNHVTFQDWLATLPDAKDAEVVFEPKLNATARELVKAALTVNGEVVPGVSAGFSAPFLQKDR